MAEREETQLWCDRGGYWVTPEFVQEQQCPYWECCQCDCSNCRANGEEGTK